MHLIGGLGGEGSTMQSVTHVRRFTCGYGA